MNLESLGLNKFLSEYPDMSVAVDQSSDLILRGIFEFSAKFKDYPTVRETYSLEIRIPEKFPNEMPRVKETDGKIPRDGKHHINPDDTLCLGSPLRIRKMVLENTTLSNFASSCLVPFLYWIALKKFAVGELEHGQPGIIADYMKLFGLTEPKQVIPALQLLGMKKCVANKKPCPCDCGMRLGLCKKRFVLNKFRSVAPRRWFRDHIRTLGQSPT